MIARIFIFSSLLLVSFQSAAAYYYLTNYNLPHLYPLPPCTGNWDISGNKYECGGSLTLQSGDEIIAYETSQLEIKNNVYFESNIIGSPSFSGVSVKSIDGHLRIIDTVIYGAAEAKQSIVINEFANGSHNSNHYSFILGKVKSSDSRVLMINTDVRGDVDAKLSVKINVRSNGSFAASRASIIEGKIKSHDSSIRVVNAQIYGDVEAKKVVNINALINGSYVPNSHVSVGGKVKSHDSSIRILNANITDDVDAKLSVNINVLSNGTYATNTSSAVGGGVVSRDQSIRLLNTNVTDNITAKKAININRLSNGTDVSSTLSSITGNIESSENDIVLGEATHVVGDVTAGPQDRGKVFVNSGSTVDGTCLYQTVPENACSSDITLPDPVALYHLDEASWNGNSNEVVDSSGNRHHGTAFNGLNTASTTPALPTISSLGTCGYGVFENQSNHYIEIADTALLDMNDSFTISAWVKPARYPISGLHSILSKDNNYEFHLNSSGQIFWWWQDKNSNGDIKTRTLTSEASIPKDKWSFITIRYDSERNDNKSLASIFINGAESGEILINANRELVNNTKPLQIGQDQNFSGRAFDGAIDEVQIFDKRLTQSEIEKLMAQRHPCSDSPILQCFTDRFDNSDLSDLWVTSTSKGPFTPQVINNRLRFTEAQEDQSTASTYQRLFPAKDNLVEIEFDHYAYGGDGADGIAIVLSDATVTPAPGAFGGPLGYGFKSGEPGFAGGWLGIGIDEYGNYSNEGGSGSKPGRRRQSVALRGSGSGETGYQYLAGACEDGTNSSNGECLDPSVDGSNDSNRANHRYKIVIDSRLNEQSNVEIFRKIGSGDWSSIVGPIDVLNNQYSQSAIPNDFLLSITGSTGNLTNIHEIDNLQVCALDSRPVGEQIDHFRLTHSGAPSTCSTESVLLEACLDVDCNSLYSGVINATLSPKTSADSSWIDENGNSNNTVTFSGGQGSFEFRKLTKGNVTLGVVGSKPLSKPLQSTLCSDGTSANTENCTLNFVEGGFDIKAEDGVANLTRTATITGCDIDDFRNKTKTLQFWSSYESPSSNNIIGSPLVDVNKKTIGTSESTSTQLDISFDDDAKATVELDYPDAGQLRLNAQYTEGSGWNKVDIFGSDSFVSYPARVEIIAVGSEGTNDNSIKNSNSPKFEKAGAIFTLQARAYSGFSSEQGEVITPNYQQASSLSFELLAPKGGQLGVAKVDGSEITSDEPNSAVTLGGNKDIPVSVSEVGIFKFEFDFSGQYLNIPYTGNIIIDQSNIASVGRFYPAYFSVVDSSLAPNLDAFCSSDNDPGLKFSYIGQNFTYEQVPELYLEAKSVEGALTNNYYHADWWRYSTPWLDRSYTDSNSRNIVFEGEGGTTSEFASGRVYLSDAELMRYEKSEPPLEPFNADFSLVLAASDLMDSDNVCVKTSDSGFLADCLSYSFSDIDEDMELRWGRLLIHDTYGPEVSPIRQRIDIQHFDNGRFTTNLLDSCTDLIAINRFDLTSGDYNLVTSGTPIPPEVNVTLLQSKAVDGESWIEFSAPGAGDTGLIDTEIDLNKHGVPWLIEDLDGEGTVSGIAQFGIYRGSDRVIWWTEKN
ncbi:DUF6701 domain-containing protein [Vibrio sp.]|uniref:DUF6701 domain-containing protein n=1 Tax=Vibrio sp. TaxID=678 RepID=UPI003F6A7D8B